MKFGPRNLRFALPLWTIFRRPVRFLRKGNTMHLQETALVIEGDLLRFRLPIIDQFIQRALSERSMLTIPYSRILRHRYCRYWTWKGLVWGWGGLPFLLLPMALALSTVDSWRDLLTVDFFVSIALAAVGMILCGVLAHLLFRSRHVLVFRQANGKCALICFRFTDRKSREKFMALLQANQEAARSLVSPANAVAEKR